MSEDAERGRRHLLGERAEAEFGFGSQSGPCCGGRVGFSKARVGDAVGMWQQTDRLRSVSVGEKGRSTRQPGPRFPDNETTVLPRGIETKIDRDFGSHQEADVPDTTT